MYNRFKWYVLDIIKDYGSIFIEEDKEMVGYSGQHLRRLIKDVKLDLVENEDYRIANNGTYLYTDIAVEKFLDYKGNSVRGKKKDE